MILVAGAAKLSWLTAGPPGIFSAANAKAEPKAATK